MKLRQPSVPDSVRRKPLAACGAVLFSLTAPAAFASSLIVGSCKDDGSSGTLRNVIAGATSGDIIDMTALNCSDISLNCMDAANALPKVVTAPRIGPAASGLRIFTKVLG